MRIVVSTDAPSQHDRPSDHRDERGDHQGGHGHHYDEDRQRRGHEESDQDDQGDLNGAKAYAGYLDDV